MNTRITSLGGPGILAVLAGVFSTAIGVTVLVGWHTHSTALLQIHPSLVAMVYNTALAFVLSGIAIVTIALRRVKFAIIGGVYTVIIGLLTLIEYISGRDFGIDQLLMHHYVQVSNPHPGRMAVNSAVFFVLVGTALLAHSLLPRLSRRALLTGIIGSITLAQGVVAFSGYLTGVTSTYAWGNVTRMAVHTAFGFATLGIGLIALAWCDHRAAEEKGAPRWLPLLVGLGIATVTLCLWQSLVIDERARVQRAVEVRKSTVKNEIASRLRERLVMMQRMAVRWAQDDVPDEQRWRYDASLVAKDSLGMQGIGWVDPSGRLRWVVPVQGNEAAIGLDLTAEGRRRAVLETARQTRQLTILLPIELAVGGKGLLVLVPIYHNEKFNGYVDGFFRMQPLFDEILKEEVTHGYNLLLSVDDEEIYRRGDKRYFTEKDWEQTAELGLPGGAWRVKVWPQTETLRDLQSYAPTASLIFGLVFAMVLAWAARLVQSTQSRSEEIVAANETLEREVSERKRAENALLEGEDRFRTMANNISQFAWMADEHGYIFWYNDRWFDYSGTTLEEMAGWGWQKVHHPDHVQRVVDKITKCFQTGETWDDTFPLRGRDGNYRWFLSRAVPIRDPDGKVLRWFGTNTDVTQSKLMEEELEQSRDAAMESVRLKSEFLANMSHEIRTPMNGVVGMTGLLLETDLTSSQREYMESIEYSADALLRIIDDILDFSKIEAGLLRFEKIDFELRGAVEATVELLAERAQTKGLELASLVHADVPTALQGDPGRLRQVLTNLIGNALKFTERGEIVISVTKVDESASQASLRFEIQDTGIGISAEAQRGLFQAFTQADGSTTRKYGGTGLGLAISKQLVELMGGQIGIESTPGFGSTFWFTAKFEKQAELTTIETGISVSSARVLIVDDNAANRRILNYQTSSWGIIATEAESGERALELLRAGAQVGRPYDIAILDLMMPEMSGFQLAEAIKADPSIAPVALVLLVSFGKRGHGEKARQVGIAAYLKKPVRQSQLYNCLTALMTRSAISGSTQSPNLVTRHSMREAEVQQREKVFSNLHIIVAEDNVVNQKVALGQLSNLGYRAVAVPNGRELLKALENAEFDLILMDCHMPEMDGFAATAEIRRREGTTRHTTIIAMTANALDGDDERCLAAGMDDYLSKPVKPDVLRRKLEHWTRPLETATSGPGI